MLRACLADGRSAWTIALLLFWALIAGCARQPVAVVDGKAIDAETLSRAMDERIREHTRRKVDVDREKLRRTVLRQLVDERLILDGAAKRGVTVSDAAVNAEVESVSEKMGKAAFRKMLEDSGETREGYRERMRKKMIVDRLIEDLVKESPPNEEEMRDYYRNSPMPFIKPARILAKMVEMSSGQEALRVMREMREKKTDFDETADRLRAEGKATVIDYGWVNADFFSPGISEGLMNLKVGRYGGPYKGARYYYLIKMKEREPERIATFDEVRDKIRETLTRERKSTVYDAWFTDVKKHSTVEIRLK